MVYTVYLGLLALIFGVKTVYWAGTETMLVFKYDVESQWNHYMYLFSVSAGNLPYYPEYWDFISLPYLS